MRHAQTIQDRLTEAAERPAGFDYLRLALAISIIAFHSYAISYGSDRLIWTSAWRAPVALLVPMFFSLSGFLVAGSLVRSGTLVAFLGLRILRIIPALAVEVVLSAVVLGALATSLPLSAYFSDPTFFSYFCNLLGDIHYELPGVFSQNPYPAVVNGPLWTVPFELICYASITGLAMVGMLRRRIFYLASIVAIHIFLTVYSIYNTGSAAGNLPGRILVINFLVGIGFFLYRDVIPCRKSLFLLSAVTSLTLMLLPFGDRFSSVPVTYLTVYLGVLNPSRNRIILSGDYSYGLYLYGWPLQQSFAAVWPFAHQWYWNLLAVLPTAGLIAVASWWAVERPALALRSYLHLLEKSGVRAKDRLAVWIFSRSGLGARQPSPHLFDAPPNG